jgi:hypothetical protein
MHAEVAVIGSKKGEGSGMTSNPPLPMVHQPPGVDTRQPWLDRATLTHPILERIAQKRKGKGSARAAAEARGEKTGGMGGWGGHGR